MHFHLFSPLHLLFIISSASETPPHPTPPCVTHVTPQSAVNTLVFALSRPHLEKITTHENQHFISDVIAGNEALLWCSGPPHPPHFTPSSPLIAHLRSLSGDAALTQHRRDRSNTLYRSSYINLQQAFGQMVELLNCGVTQTQLLTWLLYFFSHVPGDPLFALTPHLPLRGSAIEKPLAESLRLVSESTGLKRCPHRVLLRWWCHRPDDWLGPGGDVRSSYWTWAAV